MPRPRILMILTSHRLDCLRLCVDLLVQGGSAVRFDRVCILCSGVEGRHRRFVESLPRRYPGVRWDILHGPRGRGKPISDLQNACVRKYPGGLYFKIDEDTFVSSDWDQRMEEAHAAFENDTRLSLITAVVTNNQRGAYHLLTAFPELADEYTKRFRTPITAERMGPVWLYPQQAEFIIRRFLSLEAANQELRTKNGERFLTFSYPFSINCIAYDYRHWQEIGGVPEQDENGWGDWIPRNDKFIVLAAQALVHHYAFFVQQEWLDRTSLLESLRHENLPGSTPPIAPAIGPLLRTIPHIPKILMRRLQRLLQRRAAS